MRVIEKIIVGNKTVIKPGQKHKEFNDYRLAELAGEVAGSVLNVTARWEGPNPSYKVHLEYYTLMGDVAVQWREYGS